MDAETKKKLLYGAGALASIGALVLYMKNKQAASANVGYSGGAAGAGGVSSGTSANDAAAINATTAAAIEQSREQSALQIAQIQSTTALGVANIQANTVQSVNKSNLLGKIFGAGGAGTAAVAPAFDTLKTLIQDAFKAITPGNISGFTNPAGGSVLDTDNPAVSGGTGGFLTPEGIPYYLENPGYIAPETYDYSGNVIDLTTGPDSVPSFFQGTTGSGDSSWYGTSPSDSVPPSDGGGDSPFGAGVYV